MQHCQYSYCLLQIFQMFLCLMILVNLKILLEELHDADDDKIHIILSHVLGKMCDGAIEVAFAFKNFGKFEF